MISVNAIYKDGQIKLIEKPAHIKSAKVIVTFLEEPTELSTSKYDLNPFIGKLKWQGDAIVEQRRLRDEW